MILIKRSNTTDARIPDCMGALGMGYSLSCLFAVWHVQHVHVIT